MKTKIILLFIFLFTINKSFAQQMPLDFSDNSDVFTGFGGTTFARIGDPDDTNNTIGQFARAASANQGMFIDLIEPIDLDVECLRNAKEFIQEAKIIFTSWKDESEVNGCHYFKY